MRIIQHPHHHNSLDPLPRPEFTPEDHVMRAIRLIPPEFASRGRRLDWVSWFNHEYLRLTGLTEAPGAEQACDNRSPPCPPREIAT